MPPRARRIFWRAICPSRSSTRATARTSIPRRRCSTRAPFWIGGATLEGLRVAIIGDIAHSRVARSNVHLLSKFGAEIVLCGPASLLPAELAQLAPGVTLTTDMREAIRDADVIMMLRVQLERQHEAGISGQRIFPVLRPAAGAHGAGQAGRHRDASRPHQSRAARFPRRWPISSAR